MERDPGAFPYFGACASPKLAAEIQFSYLKKKGSILNNFFFDILSNL